VICATHDPAVIGQADHVIALGGASGSKRASAPR